MRGAPKYQRNLAVALPHPKYFDGSCKGRSVLVTDKTSASIEPGAKQAKDEGGVSEEHRMTDRLLPPAKRVAKGTSQANESFARFKENLTCESLLQVLACSLLLML